MGRYDKEIKMVFNHIEKLETTYYLPEDFSSLYQTLYEATIPDADIENFHQKLSALLELESMDDIKVEIRKLLKFYSYDAGSSKLDLCIRIVEYLSMSIKHLALMEVSLNNKDFIDLAYKKRKRIISGCHLEKFRNPS